MLFSTWNYQKQFQKPFLAIFWGFNLISTRLKCLYTSLIIYVGKGQLTKPWFIFSFVSKCSKGFKWYFSTFYMHLYFAKRQHRQRKTRKLCYRKDDRAMRHTYGFPANFRDSLTTPTANVPNVFNSWAFVPINPMNVPTKFEVCCFTRSWDKRG